MNKKYNNTDSKNIPLGGLGENNNNIAETKKSPEFIPQKAGGDLGVFFRSLVGLLFIFLSFAATAQPLPPSTPYGSPVPVGGAVVLLLAMAGLGIRQLMKRRNK